MDGAFGAGWRAARFVHKGAVITGFAPRAPFVAARKCTEDERSESEGTFEQSENPKGEPGVCERAAAKRGIADGSRQKFCRGFGLGREEEFLPRGKKSAGILAGNMI